VGKDAHNQQEVFMTNDLNVNEVRGAVNFGTVPYFQPIIGVTTTDQTFLEYEALGRLRLKGELLRPEQFLPCLEQAPYAAQFDRVMLVRAIEQMADWLYHDDLEVHVHVNAGAAALAQPSYATFVREMLYRHQMPAEYLTIEVIETCDFYRSEEMLGTIRALKQVGVKIAVDDFPCWSDPDGLIGWLRANHALVDSVKFDHSLVVAACDDVSGKGDLKEFVRYMDQLCKLDLTIIAEGVRNEQDSLNMQLCGVHGMQGYCIGLPMPAESVYHRSQQAKGTNFPSFSRMMEHRNLYAHVARR
jgi:EAL domain-containing protein (putative c-di-GMP-specific phosphodiesterase class I)